MTKQIAVAGLSRLVTAAAARKVTNGSITSKILFGQRRFAERMGEPASPRHVRVLRYPQRVKTALLQRHREIGRRHRIIGKKIAAPISTSSPFSRSPQGHCPARRQRAGLAVDLAGDQ